MNGDDRRPVPGSRRALGDAPGAVDERPWPHRVLSRPGVLPVVVVLGIVLLCAGTCGGWYAYTSSENQCQFARPAGLTARDLVGLYSGPGGSRLRLRADGTATSTGFTLGGDEPFPPGDATWTLYPPSSSRDDLDLAASGTTLPFAVIGSRGSPALYRGDSYSNRCDLYRFTRA